MIKAICASDNTVGLRMWDIYEDGKYVDTVRAYTKQAAIEFFDREWNSMEVRSEFLDN